MGSIYFYMSFIRNMLTLCLTNTDNQIKSLSIRVLMPSLLASTHSRRWRMLSCLNSHHFLPSFRLPTPMTTLQLTHMLHTDRVVCCAYTLLPGVGAY